MNEIWSVRKDRIHNFDILSRKIFFYSTCFSGKRIKVIKNKHSLNKNIIVFEDVEYIIDSKWLISLLKHVINNKKDLDINLSKNIDKSWSLSRMDGTLISILRCAYTEILCFNNIPTKVNILI